MMTAAMRLSRACALALSSALFLSSASPAFAAALRRAPQDELAFYLFFAERFIRLPTGWKVAKKGKDGMRFENKDAGSLTILPMYYRDCSIAGITRLMTERHGALPKDWSIGREGVQGLTNGAYTWNEPGNGAGERHWCVVPPGLVHATEVIASDEDRDTMLLIRRKILKYLAGNERRVK
jgi:hypothetical protein